MSKASWRPGRMTGGFTRLNGVPWINRHWGSGRNCDSERATRIFGCIPEKLAAFVRYFSRKCLNILTKGPLPMRALILTRDARMLISMSTTSSKRPKGSNRPRGQRGHAVMEFALFLPYLFFTFVGAFDWGNYSWALMKAEGAARIAALYTSSGSSTASDSGGACTYALGEFADAPNMVGKSNCTGPLTVTASLVTGPDGNNASQVTVSYQTVPLIGIPGLLPGQMTISRTVTMMLRS